MEFGRKAERISGFLLHSQIWSSDSEKKERYSALERGAPPRKLATDLDACPFRNGVRGVLIRLEENFDMDCLTVQRSSTSLESDDSTSRINRDAFPVLFFK